MSIFSTINSALFSQKKVLFGDDIKEDLHFLEGSIEAEMTLEKRSYSQYRSQNKNIKKLPRFLLNTLSAIGGPFFIGYCFFSSKFKRVGSQEEVDGGNRDIRQKAVFLFSEQQLLPEGLKKEYEIYTGKTGYCLEGKDLIYVWKELITNYWRFPYFLMKSVMKIAIYRFNDRIYQPQAIICSCEYSFTSSILTSFCRRNNIEHINIMHGDKILDIVDSFFEFDKFYVWDEEYIEIFKLLKVAPEQFIIEIPKCFYLTEDKNEEPNKENTVKKRGTYYLQDQRKGELEEIRKNLLLLREKFQIFIRRHPLYNTAEGIQEIFFDFDIEEPAEVSIWESLQRTDYLISIYSSVLFQGYINDKQIIIDDLSNKDLLKKLSERKYIMLNKKHELLSDYIISCNN